MWHTLNCSAFPYSSLQFLFSPTSSLLRFLRPITKPKLLSNQAYKSLVLIKEMPAKCSLQAFFAAWSVLLSKVHLLGQRCAINPGSRDLCPAASPQNLCFVCIWGWRASGKGEGCCFRVFALIPRVLKVLSVYNVKKWLLHS